MSQHLLSPALYGLVAYFDSKPLRFIPSMD